MLVDALSRVAGLAHVFTADGLDDIIWRSAQEFCNDRELVDVVLSGEKRLALEHFCKDAACTPDVDLNIVFLPCKHDFRCAVVPGGDVSGHLRVLYTGQAEVADLQITVLVDEDVAGLQVTVHDTGGVDVFQPTLFISVKCSDHGQFDTYQDLVKKVLDELLLQRPGGEQAVQIGAEKFGDEVTKRSAVGSAKKCTCNVHVLQRGDEDVAQTDNLVCCQNMFSAHVWRVVRTFSCLRCLSSFNSR